MEDLEWKARLLKALANPRRLRIVKELYHSPKSFSELLQRCGFRSSGELGFHLGMLRGLVKKREDGLYELTESGRKFVDFIEGFGNITPKDTFVKVPPSSLDYVLIFTSISIFLFSISLFVSGFLNVNSSSISMIFVTNGFVAFFLIAMYIFRFEIIEKYPYLINLPAFMYLLGNPLLSPQKKGEIVNKIFRIHLVSSNIISAFTLVELGMVTKQVEGFVAITLPLLTLLFIASIIIYYRKIYRKMLEEI